MDEPRRTPLNVSESASVFWESFVNPSDIKTLARSFNESSKHCLYSAVLGCVISSSRYVVTTAALWMRWRAGTALNTAANVDVTSSTISLEDTLPNGPVWPGAGSDTKLIRTFIV